MQRARCRSVLSIRSSVASRMRRCNSLRRSPHRSFLADPQSSGPPQIPIRATVAAAVDMTAVRNQEAIAADTSHILLAGSPQLQPVVAAAAAELLDCCALKESRAPHRPSAQMAPCTLRRLAPSALMAISRSSAANHHLIPHYTNLRDLGTEHYSTNIRYVTSE